MVSTSEARFDSKYVAEHYPYKGNAYVVNNTLQLRKLDYETHYLNKYSVWIEGRHVADISTDCRRASQAQSIKLSFKNNVFYTLPGWAFYLDIIEQCLPLGFQLVSYVEVAFHFQTAEPLRPRMWHIYSQSTFVKDVKNPLYAPLRGMQTCSLHYGESYTFGSKKDGKQIAVYNKTQEIAENGYEKQYILDCLAANGFDMGADVEKIEAKLGGKYFARQKDECPPAPSDLHGATLWHIFKKALGDTLTFRKLTEHTFDANRNRKTATVTLFELPDEVTQPRPAPYAWREERDESEHRNRIEAKNAVTRFIRHGRPEDLTQLDYLRKHVKAPKGTDWKYLLNRYAQDYTGAPSVDSRARIEMFG